MRSPVLPLQPFDPSSPPPLPPYWIHLRLICLTAILQHIFPTDGLWPSTPLSQSFCNRLSLQGQRKRQWRWNEVFKNRLILCCRYHFVTLKSSAYTRISSAFVASVKRVVSVLLWPWSIFKDLYFARFTPPVFQGLWFLVVVLAPSGIPF